MKINIQTSYTGYGEITIELPNNKTWDDVEQFWVKWGTAHIIFKGEIDTYEFYIDNNIQMDMKRPDKLEVYLVNENGNVNYRKRLLIEE